MASVFGHAITALTATSFIPAKINKWKFGFLAIICATIPDADVLMFDFGFSYNHWLGHRGFFHSIFFAFIFGFIIKSLFYREHKIGERTGLVLFLAFSFITMSHGVLDAMTTGGRGIAFFSPFDNTRHFLPWRMIKVSPLHVSRFFSEWGIEVIKSELYWIGMPCLLIYGMKKIISRS